MKKVNLQDINPLALAEGVTARIVNGENMTIMHARLEKGATVPEHSHLHEQVVNVIEGEIELTVEGEPHLLSPGEVLVLPSHIPHSARAVTECYVIDLFHPIREDLAAAGFTGYSSKDES